MDILRCCSSCCCFSAECVHIQVSDCVHVINYLYIAVFLRHTFVLSIVANYNRVCAPQAVCIASSIYGASKCI